MCVSDILIIRLVNSCDVIWGAIDANGLYYHYLTNFMVIFKTSLVLAVGQRCKEEGDEEVYRKTDTWMDLDWLLIYYLRMYPTGILLHHHTTFIISFYYWDWFGRGESLARFCKFARKQYHRYALLTLLIIQLAKYSNFSGVALQVLYDCCLRRKL